MNKNDETVGSNKLTLLSNDTVVRCVECIIETKNSRGKAEVYFNDWRIPDCPVEADEEGKGKDVTEEPPISDGLSEDGVYTENFIIGLAVTGIITTMLLIVFAYFIRRVTYPSDIWGFK